MTDVQAFPPDEALPDRRRVPTAMGASQQSAGTYSGEPDPYKAADYARQGEFNQYSGGGGGGTGTGEPARAVRPPPWGFYALVATLALGSVLAGTLLGNSLNDVVGLRAVRQAQGEASTTEETTVAAKYIVPTTSAPPSDHTKKGRALKKKTTAPPLSTDEAASATPALEDAAEKEEGGEEEARPPAVKSRGPRGSRRPTKKASSTRRRKKKAKAATH
ncbi:uncharacterized protein LOC144149707 [Haemaphysalis longicornis]